MWSAGNLACNSFWCHMNELYALWHMKRVFVLTLWCTCWWFVSFIVQKKMKKKTQTHKFDIEKKANFVMNVRDAIQANYLGQFRELLTTFTFNFLFIILFFHISFSKTTLCQSHSHTHKSERFSFKKLHNCANIQPCYNSNCKFLCK